MWITCVGHFVLALCEAKGDGRCWGEHSLTWSGQLTARNMTSSSIASSGGPATHLFRSQLSFETFLMVYLMTCFLLQNVNLYKSNMSSMDVDLMVFTAVFLSRRLSWILLRDALDGFRTGPECPGFRALGGQVGRLLLLGLLAGGLIWSLAQLVRKASIFDCLFLVYPLVLYLSMFGFVFDPASQPVVKLPRGGKKVHYVQLLRAPISVPSADMDILTSSQRRPHPDPPLMWASAVHGGHVEQLGNQWSSGAEPSTAHPVVSAHSRDTTKLVKRKGDTSQRGSEGKNRRSALMDELLSNGIPHPESKRESLICLPGTPEEIRTEVESMLEDVMSRVKQLLFNSVLCTYYTAFIPLQFVGDHMFYDRWWCIEHGLIVWCTCFVLLASHLLPPHYCTALNHLAVHWLGIWSRVPCQESVPEWSRSVAWARDTVVRWEGEVFRAEGNINVAIPGNTSHEYFYALFQSRVYIYTWLVALETVAVLMLLVALFKSHHWHQCLSAAALLSVNYYLFYRLLLNRLSLRHTAGRPPVT